MASKFDIVVFGATGYAGQYVVEHLANPKSIIEGLTWAVAGRNADKLVKTLETVGSWVGSDLGKVERIVASVDDEASLNAMCQRAKCLVNCVGPYSLYGEPVVKAAVANNCHHIDLSGEELYLKSMQMKYGSKAEQAKVFVISACGFDSAVCDMGVEFLTQNCPYLLNGVSTYLVPHMPSVEVNAGTWCSAVNAAQDWQRKGPVDQVLFSKQLPEPRYQLPAKFLSYKSGKFVNAWAFWFPGVDRIVARMTQYYKYANENKRPIQVENFVCAERRIQILGAGFTFLNLGFWSLTSWGRKLLQSYPEVFSFGTFRTEGPKREAVLNRSFEMVFEGEAFDAKNNYDVSADDPEGAPTKKVSCRVVGPDPAYVTCATCMVQAAVVLLKERDKLPGGVDGGGVVTPAVAFGRTGYIERLCKHDLMFEMLENTD